MKVRNEIAIKMSTKKTWEVMGNQFDQIHIWASFFIDSKPVGEKKFNEITFSGRDVVVQNGENTHSLDVFDMKNYILSYTVTAGAPPFAEKAEAKWSLEVIDENNCRAIIDVIMELKNVLPEEKVTEVSMWLNKSSQDMLEEMKCYVETGKLHARKLAQ
tara:strand:- start:915 stop:1391 length:477 start_codon:yes stop_codon:yes gene_type:complete